MIRILKTLLVAAGIATACTAQADTSPQQLGQCTAALVAQSSYQGHVDSRYARFFASTDGMHRGAVLIATVSHDVGSDATNSAATQYAHDYLTRDDAQYFNGMLAVTVDIDAAVKHGNRAAPTQAVTTYCGTWAEQ